MSIENNQSLFSEGQNLFLLLKIPIMKPIKIPTKTPIKKFIPEFTGDDEAIDGELSGWTVVKLAVMEVVEECNPCFWS